MRALIEQNLETNNKDKFPQQIRLAFKTRKRTDIIGYWKLKKNTKHSYQEEENLYSLELLQDYLMATKCYKCYNFRHIAKYCQNEKKILTDIAQRKDTFKKPTKPRIQFVIIAKKAVLIRRNGHDLSFIRDCVESDQL